MESTTDHPPADDMLPMARTGSPRPPWLAARVTVVALVSLAIFDVLKTIVAMGHYENRITVVTHGEVDVLPAWLVYDLFDYFLPSGMVTTVTTGLWLLALLGTGIAVITWLVQAQRNAVRLGGEPVWTPAWAAGGWFIPLANLVIPYLVVRDVRRASGRSPVGRATAMAAPVGPWWAGVIVTLHLNLLAGQYAVLTSAGGALERTALDTRPVAYALWTLGSVALMVTAILSASVVLRITVAQERATS